jgi:CubicO group peptidase (beta-lactamase class C family)
MKAIVLIFLFVGIETSCKNNTIHPAKPKSNEPVVTSAFRPLTQQEKSAYTQKATALYKGFLNNNFNGTILIAKNGEVLLEKYNGYADFATKETITQNTAFHVASISKTFTAMTVLKLWEQGRLNLEDNVNKYYPSFPYPNITIKSLLTHRTGLSNYAYVMNTTNKYVIYNNNDVVNYFLSNKPRLQFTPNTRFQYCNTNYVFLAGIVEKITNQSFPDYMRDSVFTPLGMYNTYICHSTTDDECPPSYTPGNKKFEFTNFDAIYGDKNVFSTARDLLTWDKVLYSNSFVRNETAQMAFQPYSNEKPGIHNYGMGWRLITKDASKIVYHTGWWHGNCNIFTRIPADTATVIILSNRYNTQVFKSRNLASVFSKAIDGIPEEDLSQTGGK